MNENNTQTLSLGQASIPAVNQYLQLASEQQLDVSALLTELAIDEALLADHDSTISGETFQQLIAGLIARSDDPLFGLHTAKFVQPGSYSVLGFMVMNCETLGEAINKIQPFEKLVGDMGTTSLTEHGAFFKIGWHCIFPNKLVRRHMIDNCLSSWLTFARYLTHNKGNAEKVLLTRSAPDLAQCNEYHAVFNCPVLFEQKSNEIIFKKSLLAFPLHTGNKQLLPTLEQHANSIINNLAQGDNIVETTKKLVLLALTDTAINQQFIAKKLHISAKTLQRRLKAHNTHFKALVDDVRLTKAKNLLTANLDNAETISAQLGFAEPRSFYRWFQKQTQQTPREFRSKVINDQND
jgi:AraC-like DNA-binding protein